MNGIDFIYGLWVITIVFIIYIAMKLERKIDKLEELLKEGKG